MMMMMMMMMMMLICRMLGQFSPGGEYPVCQTIHRVQTSLAAQTLLYKIVNCYSTPFLVLVSETPRRPAQCSPRGHVVGNWWGRDNLEGREVVKQVLGRPPSWDRLDLDLSADPNVSFEQVTRLRLYLQRIKTIIFQVLLVGT
ncbi:hypothetical protein V8F33_007376 [Rhypophila sp. PSN 637]